MVRYGTPKATTTTPLKLIIESTGKSLANFNGFRINFRAASDPANTGIALNSTQGIKFNNIRLTLRGGLTIDLNDND